MRSSLAGATFATSANVDAESAPTSVVSRLYAGAMFFEDFKIENPYNSPYVVFIFASTVCGINATSKFKFGFFAFISAYSEAKPKYVARSSLKNAALEDGIDLFHEYTFFFGLE